MPRLTTLTAGAGGYLSPTHQLRQHEPLFAVQELSHDIELSGVTRRLDNDMKDDFSKGVDSPIAELLRWPPQWFGFERNWVNDLIGPGGLFQVSLEDI